MWTHSTTRGTERFVAAAEPGDLEAGAVADPAEPIDDAAPVEPTEEPAPVIAGVPEPEASMAEEAAEAEADGEPTEG